MAVHEWLQMQQSDFYHVETFKHVPRLEKYINVLEDCVEKRNFSALKAICLMLQ
jgi:hypothetical protein